jgi:hypothetical protein
MHIIFKNVSKHTWNSDLYTFLKFKNISTGSCRSSLIFGVNDSRARAQVLPQTPQRALKVKCFTKSKHLFVAKTIPPFFPENPSVYTIHLGESAVKELGPSV